jgi:hypothetical protein
LAPGKLILARIPGESPPEVVSEAAFREGGGRIVKWLGILACVFLAFVATIVFLGFRKQRRLSKSGETSRGDGDA